MSLHRRRDFGMGGLDEFPRPRLASGLAGQTRSAGPTPFFPYSTR